MSSLRKHHHTTPFAVSSSLTDRRCHLRRFALAVAAVIAGSLPRFAAAQATDTEQQLALRVEEVVVTGPREANAVRKASTAPLLVTNTEELERYSDATVGDVLRRLAGMSFTGPAGVVKDIRMRGLDKGFTQFLINGEPVPAGKQDHALQVDRLPADMIERVEIIRSPSARYAAYGIAGTINIVLKSKPDGITRLRAALGTQGRFTVGDAIAQWSNRGDVADLLFALSYTKAAEDIVESKQTYGATGALTGGEIKPKPVSKDEILFTPTAAFKFAGGKLKFDGFISRGTEKKHERSETLNATGAVTKRSETAEDKTDEVSRTQAGFDRTERWGQWSVRSGIAFGKDQKDKPATERNATGVVTKRSLEVEDGQESERFVTGQLDVAVGSQHRIFVGVELRDADYEKKKIVYEATSESAPLVAKAPGNNDVYRIDEVKTVFFAQDEWRLHDRHALTAGVRFEQIQRTATDRLGAARDGRSRSPNPSLQYRWQLLDDLTLRAAASETIKQPKFDELNPLLVTATGAGAGSSTNPDKAGNPDLKPLKSRGLDAGGEYYFWGNRGVLGANLYQRDVSDFIEKQTRQEGARHVERPYNVGQARFWGAELDVRWPLLRDGGHRLVLTGNHSFHRGYVVSTRTGRRNDIKDMPKTVTNVGLDYTHGSSGLSAGLSYSLVPAFTRDSTNDENGNREVKSRNRSELLDVYLARTLGARSELRFVARNLLSVEKSERTTKYKANGTFDVDEVKVETSKPTYYLTFEYRF